ncbi:hypothetical protein SAMN05878503_103314 [Cereibacter ovatus]|uniref:TrgA family protein n=1 Tax=Cereibacter ovatus TaxID=439529 RepID=A0A285CPI4_9RHOB|nr:TrgA family protein [Cereibacter ovatus]SNX69325.1 hypothetical protein SAMN05878503_103314 [Cereibacter ovatus]
MPTAAKLFAALAFAALGFLAGGLFGQQLPEGTPTATFGPAAALIGLICGWRISGALAGRGFGVAMGTGVRTAVTILFWGLLAYSIQIMLIRAMRKLYHGPMEALVGVVDLMLDHARLALAPELLAALLVGGFVGGALAEWAGRRWS